MTRGKRARLVKLRRAITVEIRAMARELRALERKLKPFEKVFDSRLAKILKLQAKAGPLDDTGVITGWAFDTPSQRTGADLVADMMAVALQEADDCEACLEEL